MAIAYIIKIELQTKILVTFMKTTLFPLPVADPGFPVGGRGPVRGAWTPDVGAFRQKCMQK